MEVRTTAEVSEISFGVKVDEIKLVALVDASTIVLRGD